MGELGDVERSGLPPVLTLCQQFGEILRLRCEDVFDLGAEEGENGEGTAFVPTPSGASDDQFADVIRVCLYGREPRYP